MLNLPKSSFLSWPKRNNQQVSLFWCTVESLKIESHILDVGKIPPSKRKSTLTCISKPRGDTELAPVTNTSTSLTVQSMFPEWGYWLATMCHTFYYFSGQVKLFSRSSQQKFLLTF